MKNDEFKEHPLFGFKVPNGYIAIPVDFYLDLLLNTRAIANIEKEMRELCIESARTNFEPLPFNGYEPGFMTSKELSIASLGVIEEFTEQDAIDACREMGFDGEYYG